MSRSRRSTNSDTPDAMTETPASEPGGPIDGVAIPPAIWRGVKPWRGDFLRHFDVRLNDGRVIGDMGVRNDGVIEGRLEPGRIVLGDLGFTSDDIAAVRPRSGGLLAPLGLKRWVTRE